MNVSDENGLCFTAKPFSVVIEVVVVEETTGFVTEVVEFVVEEAVEVVVEETTRLVTEAVVLVTKISVVVSSTICLHCAGGKSLYSGNFGRNIEA